MLLLRLFGEDHLVASPRSKPRISFGRAQMHRFCHFMEEEKLTL